ncbi:substrate-binding periplasmic protein [Algicola sagamiensis]|uniref:substrate-binding periplasmic protein n=1 Tax=Algicola sagamiensis TaxID=163869 RepID=UPI00036A4DAA|nr:transporter substrate-binding domain-containing protein [Algicola sagamiensis]
MVSRLFSICLFLFANFLRAEQEIIITNGEWPPFLGEELPHHGAASQIVAEAFKTQSYTVQYEFLPWSRSFKDVQHGRRAASVIWTFKQDRTSYLHFSEPVIELSDAFFYHVEGSFEWHDINSLKKQLIGVVASYSYGQAFDDAVKYGSLKVESVSLDNQNVKKLLSKRIDAMLVNDYVGKALINVLPGKHSKLIKMHPKYLRTEQFRLIISKKWKNSDLILKEFNEGLKAIQESGQMAKILKRLEEGYYQ